MKLYLLLLRNLYACTTDYRKIKFVEVSCTDIIPEDNNYTYSSNDFEVIKTNDTNISKLEAIDPQKASLQNNQDLNAIEKAIKDVLAPKIDISNEKLSKINTAITDIALDSEDIVENTEDIAENTGNINEGVKDTNVNLTGVRSDLGSINDTLNDTGTLTGNETIFNKNNFNSDTTALDDTSYMDNLSDNISELTEGIISIKDDFTSTNDLISGNKPVVSISGGSCSDANILKFASYISPYSSIFALLTYLGFMISIFKMIFSYLSKGD